MKKIILLILVSINFNLYADAYIKLVPNKSGSDIYIDRNIIDFPVNTENINAINGIWTITDYILNFGSAEKYNKDHSLELIGNGKVRVAGDDELVYMIVNFDGTSISLVKEIDGGHEILKAVRPIERESEVVEVVEENERAVRRVNGLDIVEDMELVLVKVSNSTKKVEVSGSLELTTEGEVLSFIINGDEVVVEDNELKVGGIFSAELNGEMISGRISNNGNKNNFRVIIFTGSLAGTSMDFENVYTTNFDGDVVTNSEFRF